MFLNFLFIMVQNPLYNKILSMYFLGFLGWKKYMIYWFASYLVGRTVYIFYFLFLFLMISINVFLLNVCRILHPFFYQKCVHLKNVSCPLENISALNILIRYKYSPGN